MLDQEESKALQVLDGLRHFMENRVVFTAVELGIFDFIEQMPSEPLAEDFSRELQVDLRAVTRLLDCLVALEFLDKTSEGRYRLTEKGAFLTSTHPYSILPMVQHQCLLWKNWSHLTDAVRHGFNPHRESVMSSEESKRAFIQAMHVVARSLARSIVAGYDASWAKKLLDIGCASGTYTVAFLSAYPNMKAVLFDLPDVMPFAEERIKKEGFSNRVSFVAGDFYKDELPTGCDLALLSAIIHQNSAEENIELFKKVYRALEPGGRILIRDHVMSEDRTWPPAGTLFALNMLVVTPGGDTYTFSELSEFLKEAGFENARLVRSGPKMDCLVEAHKP